MNVVLATSNRGKVREFEILGASAGWTFVLPATYEAPLEDGSTYAENAAIKAVALWRALRDGGSPAAVLGDDSGLEVRALDGRPGLLSARYGGENATWHERRLGILEELRDARSPDRAARFVCALHFIDAAGNVATAFDAYDGTIAQSALGTSGFSYDPIFVDPETGLTFGELPEAEKNAKSHRARAFATLLINVASPPFANSQIVP